MNKLTKLFALVAGFAGFAALVATADPLNITVGSDGGLLNGVGIADSTYYTAHVTPPPSNNASDNLDFLNTEIGYWNANFDPDLPGAGVLALSEDSLGDVSSYTTKAGYDYVVFHFGSGPAGSEGGWWQAYYLGGEGGFVLSPLPVVGDVSVGGFSSARYFGGSQVPDSGSTVALLGLSLIAVAFAARRRQSAA